MLAELVLNTTTQAQGASWKTKQKDCKVQRMGGELQNIFFWSWHGCHIHELTVIVVTCQEVSPRLKFNVNDFQCLSWKKNQHTGKIALKEHDPCAFCMAGLSLTIRELVPKGTSDYCFHKACRILQLTQWIWKGLVSPALLTFVTKHTVLFMKDPGRSVVLLVPGAARLVLNHGFIFVSTSKFLPSFEGLKPKSQPLWLMLGATSQLLNCSQFYFIPSLFFTSDLLLFCALYMATSYYVCWRWYP